MVCAGSDHESHRIAMLRGILYGCPRWDSLPPMPSYALCAMYPNAGEHTIRPYAMIIMAQRRGCPSLFQYRPNPPRARADRLLLDDPKIPQPAGALDVRPAADLLAPIANRIHLHLRTIALAEQTDRAGVA